MGWGGGWDLAGGWGLAWGGGWDLSLDTPDTARPRRRETVFICPAMHGIEEMGEVGRAMATEVLFHRCRDSGMLLETEEGFSIASHRAQELVREIKKASSMQYFQRFFVILEQTLRSQGLQASGAFSCDWDVIQEALASAVREDQAINRMLLVSGLGHCDFTGQPLTRSILLMAWSSPTADAPC